MPTYTDPKGRSRKGVLGHLRTKSEDGMKIHEALVVTYATIGQEATDAQLAVMAQELQGYRKEDVLESLSRCRRELRRITLADILERMPGGHPGVEEAWAIVAKTLTDENVTIVWTDEMREAFGVARQLSEDRVAARQAFKETYVRLVHEARNHRRPPQWTVSLGHDAGLRESVLVEAVHKGRLLPQVALKYLPPTVDVSVVEQVTALVQPLLESSKLPTKT